MNNFIDFNSRRAYEARLGKRIGKTGYVLILTLSGVLAIAAIIIGIRSSVSGLYIFGALAILFFMPAIWWKRQLSVLPITDKSFTGRLSYDVLSNINTQQLDNQTLWQALQKNWQTVFIMNHLLLSPETLSNLLNSDGKKPVDEIFQIAASIADSTHNNQIEVGYLITGILYTSPSFKQLLVNAGEDVQDIMSVGLWLGRNLNDESNREKRYFGGIGRDWANGFTPLLNRFGLNVSLAIADHGAFFGSLTESIGVKSIESAFDKGSNAVALIGETGIGKTNTVNALAQRLIEGKTTGKLAYHQVVILKSTDITSSVRNPRDLENLMVRLANEASHAGHIILFFDDAESFLIDKPGTIDASQILLSIVQARSVQLILALTPHGFETLKVTNPSLASALAPIVLTEPDEKGVLLALEDYVLKLEHKNKILVSYDALHEAYRLSQKYMSDQAMPGKAITLLERSASFVDKSVLTKKSVQECIEQSTGIKVAGADPMEADKLLNLEALIHARMIGQEQAVTAVASTLRRARAGVSSQNRPLGSFLFLGPTGVGKTELAKSLAATYFNDEANMIRIDMSEYQQDSDVQRLLNDGSDKSSSLIMQVRQKPFSVILLDEVEKAHPNILNLLLQLLDEGQLTDLNGRRVSFRECIIIATSNAGAPFISEQINNSIDVTSIKDPLIDLLIRDGSFKPELLNRFDDIVIFKPLQKAELNQVVSLLVQELNRNLSLQNIVVQLTPEAVEYIVETGYDPRLGARPMRRTLQKAVEDTLAKKILQGEAKPGSQIQLTLQDLQMGIQNPIRTPDQPAQPQVPFPNDEIQR